MSRFYLILIVVLSSMYMEAQRWNKLKYEAILGLGATNFLGDLGGADQIGTNGIKDLEVILTRPSVMGGFRYKFDPYMSVKGTVTWGILRGDDKLTSEFYRNNRNLSFRAHLWELSAQFEGHITREQSGHRYKIKGAKGFKNLRLNIYGFAGVAMIWFNPKAQDLGGKWTALQPLGTEGQGIKPGTHKYSRLGVSVPFGIGISKGLDRYWSVGIEMGLRKTFTDYIDDVSTTYYTDSIRVHTNNDPVAVYFADPSMQLGPSPISVRQGEQRGDPSDKDAYMFIHLTVSMKIVYRKSTRPKF
jgi:hypothetical protein